jgi:hypothetical protein
MKWDHVVLPQPPVLRAIEHTRRVLLAAGHEGLTAAMHLVEANADSVQ